MRHNAPFSKIEPGGRRGQWRRGFLLAAVAVLALTASLVMTPAPAEAQSTVTLVSNLGRGTTETSTVGPVAHNRITAQATGFTTGTNVGGYELASVTLTLREQALGTSPVPVVNIHGDSNGAPGDQLFTLTNPSDFDLGATNQDFAFTAPAGATLMPNTTYWVVVYSTGSRMFMIRTTYLGHNPEREPGWTLCGCASGSSVVGGAFGSWVTVTDKTYLMAVRGVVLDTLVSNLGTTGLSEENVAYGDLGRLASKFTTGPNRGGYRLDSVTLRLRRNEAVSQGEIHTEIKIYRDSDGLPGSEFFTLDSPPNISEMPSSYSNYKFTAPTDADTRLPPNRTYWVVASLTRVDNNSIFWQNGDFVTEQPGWSIGNSAARIPFFVPIWHAETTTALKMSVQGEVLRTSDLPTKTEWADYDLPLSDDTWGYVDTSGPSSGTLNDPP